MRSWILSALLLSAATAFGQQPLPPAGDDPRTKERLKQFLNTIQPEKPPAPGSVDEAVLNALRQHPDIKLAEAKRQVAEAEVEQAKSQVALRVAAAFAKLAQAKAELAVAEKQIDIRQGSGSGTASEMLVLAAQAQRMKSAVVAAEVELNAAKGTAPRIGGAAADLRNEAAVEAGLKWLSRMQEAGVAPAKLVPVGTMADRLRKILDKPVTLDLTGADLPEAMAAVLKSAGEQALPVKLPTLGRTHLKEPPTVTAKGEMSFAAAVQLILDEINRPDNGAVFEALKGQQEVYVREYGLLVARVQDAPKDAPTLAEFARQVRAEKK